MRNAPPRAARSTGRAASCRRNHPALDLGRVQQRAVDGRARGAASTRRRRVVRTAGRYHGRTVPAHGGRDGAGTSERERGAEQGTSNKEQGARNVRSSLCLVPCSLFGSAFRFSFRSAPQRGRSSHRATRGDRPGGLVRSADVPVGPARRGSRCRASTVSPRSPAARATSTTSTRRALARRDGALAGRRTACSRRSSSIPAFDWSQVVGRDRGRHPGQERDRADRGRSAGARRRSAAGHARRRGARAGRRADPRARVRRGDARSSRGSARCRAVFTVDDSLAAKRAALRRRQRVQAVPASARATRATPSSRPRSRSAAHVIEGTLPHVAAGADVHRAAGDDGRVARRPRATSSARCSARTTCTRR